MLGSRLGDEVAVDDIEVQPRNIKASTVIVHEIGSGFSEPIIAAQYIGQSYGQNEKLRAIHNITSGVLRAIA